MDSVKTQINLRIHEVWLVSLPSTYINEVLFKINIDITTDVWVQLQLLITTTTTTTATTTATTTTSTTASTTTTATAASAVAITIIVAVAGCVYYYSLLFLLLCMKPIKVVCKTRGKDPNQSTYPCSLINLHHALIL